MLVGRVPASGGLSGCLFAFRATLERDFLDVWVSGEISGVKLATSGHTPEQLCDALAACVDVLPVYRRLLKMELERSTLRSR